MGSIRLRSSPRAAAILAALLPLLACELAFSQPPGRKARERGAAPLTVGEGWREVEVQVGLRDLSVRDGVQAALTAARLEAVAGECGIVFDSLSWARAPLAVRECLDLLERAHVVEERVVRWDAVVDGDRPRQPPEVRLQLRAQLRASNGAGLAPGSFQVRAALDSLIYRPEDDVSLSVQPSHNCHVTVLLFAPDDSVYVVYPNAMQPDRAVAPPETLRIPSGMGRRTGLVRIPAPAGASGEPGRCLLWVVALPDPLKLPPPLPLGRGLVSLGTVPAALRLLSEQLISRPPPQRAMESLQVETSARGLLKERGPGADP